MIPLTLGEIARVTAGTLRADAAAVVSGDVVIDSRKVVPSGLFCAVPGERVDGHDFATAAIAAGATAVLGTREIPDVPMIMVGDVAVALGKLARHVVDSLPSVTIAGITGSSGKTSVKDLAAQLIERLGPTIAPAGSFNNEYGLPLTVLRAGSGTRYLVLEMSARGVGHIAYLCGIAPPRYGAVLNVGRAHAGEFGSMETVARAKGELVEALPADGVAILNAADPRVAAMAVRTRARVITFAAPPPTSPTPTASPTPPAPTASPTPPAPSVSIAQLSPLERVNPHEQADIRAADVRLDELGRPSFILLTPEGHAPVTLRLHGAHHVPNALAAAALARELGLGLGDIADGLSSAVPRSRWRMEVATRADGVIVINDAYNANPESVRAALDALAHLARDGRAFAVLGHMAELGDSSRASHEEIGEHAAAAGVAGLIAVGAEARPILDGARRSGQWRGEALAVPDGASALTILRDRLKPGDVVLVKASRAAGLEGVAADLLTEADQ
ncbi:MAG TPA: UDP-N-acetylmuramoyl-tripeptide--D-alanyl-D-alanine ligase [Streptosporangiaceae bacterium]|nr:UDP-N-acetylmuramoyl-tripeptide--D-alanyl-D-alanine ligase [Streptosporangiaceae bacterium]